MKKGKQFPYKKQFFINYTIAFAIIITTFLGMGYIIGFLENFNYVAYSINAAVFGSFFFSLYERERKIQKDLNKSYRIVLGIIYDLLGILVVQLSVTGILFYFAFAMIVSLADLLLCLILSTLIFLAQFRLASITEKNLISSIKTNISRENVVVKSFWYILFVHQYYMIALYIHVFDSILVMMLIWTILLLGLFGVRYCFRNSYIKGLSNPTFKYSIYFVVLIVLSKQTPSLMYDLHVKDIVYLEKSPKVEHVGVIETPTVTNYFNGDYIFYEDHVLVDSRRPVVYENEYINSDSVIAFDEDGNVTGYETIDLIGEIYHHVILYPKDGKLLESFHEETTSKPEYFNERLSTKNGPARIYQVINLNDKIYIKSEIGLLIYDMNYVLEEVIPKDVRIPTDIDAAFESTTLASYSATYGEYTVVEDYETKEYMIMHDDVAIKLESPDKYIQSGINNYSVLGLLVSDEYFIVTSNLYLITYTKDGDYVDSISYPLMFGFQNGLLIDNVFTSVYASYYDQIHYSFDNYDVLQINPSDYGKYVLRNDFQSYQNCEIPFGCTYYYVVRQTKHVYIQFLVSLMVLMFPSNQKEENKV